MMSLSVQDAATLMSDANLRPALTGAISNIIGVSKNRVRIDSMAAQRRLGEGSAGALARRLSQLLRVGFTVLARDTQSAGLAAAILRQTVPAAMQQRVDESLASHGVAHSVLVYDVQYSPSNPLVPAYWEPVTTAAPASSSVDDNGVSLGIIVGAIVGGVLGCATLATMALLLGYYLRGGTSAKTTPAKDSHESAKLEVPAALPPTKGSTARSSASTEAGLESNHSLLVSATSTMTSGQNGSRAVVPTGQRQQAPSQSVVQQSQLQRNVARSPSTPSPGGGGGPGGLGACPGNSVRSGGQRDQSLDVAAYSQKVRAGGVQSGRTSSSPSVSSSRSGQQAVRRQTSQGQGV